jgi:riboflavin-specific deaminase-like protein
MNHQASRGCAADEEAAWTLLQRLRGRTLSGQGLEFADASGLLPPLTVLPDGGWRSSSPWPEAASRLLDLYLPLCVTPSATFTMAQMGQSTDGRIATETGASHYVTGADDIVRLHRLRALFDAVLVGASTVVADDPRLTVRRVAGDHPVRVVLDTRGTVPATRRLFVDGAAPTLWLRPANAVVPAPPSPQVEVVPLPEVGQEDLPAAVLALLHRRGLGRVLIEGGGITVSRFLAAGCLDRLHVSVAPLIIGSGRPSFTLPAVARLDKALRPRCRHFKLGEDMLFDFDLRR